MRSTVENMARAGELSPVGRIKAPGARVYRCVYALRDPTIKPDAGLALAGALASWGRQVPD